MLALWGEAAANYNATIQCQRYKSRQWTVFDAVYADRCVRGPRTRRGVITSRARRGRRACEPLCGSSSEGCRRSAKRCSMECKDPRQHRVSPLGAKGAYRESESLLLIHQMCFCVCSCAVTRQSLVQSRGRCGTLRRTMRLAFCEGPWVRFAHSVPALLPQEQRRCATGDHRAPRSHSCHLLHGAGRQRSGSYDAEGARGAPRLARRGDCQRAG